MTARSGCSMPVELHCPACNELLTASEIAGDGFRCHTCGAEVGHLNRSLSGAVCGVLGWLHSPGDVLAERYRVCGLLGKGGFAATYLVQDERLAGKRRAIKEIPEHVYDEREIEILARLHHQALPDIIDRFTAERMVYLVLEFGGERTLETVRTAAGGKIALTHLWPWIDQLCEVLTFLHAQKPPIVHRDLKPANVLLDEADRVMLIDFGIARTLTADDVTQTVVRSASHGFSPPEQIMGVGTDARSDVYALGATVYVLLTGNKPPPAHERVAGIQVESPRLYVPDLPPTVEHAILRALELSMERRYRSIAELRDALANGHAASGRDYRERVTNTEFLGKQPADMSNALRLKRFKGLGAHGAANVVLVLVGILVCVGLAGGAWWLSTRSTEAPTVISTTPTATSVPSMGGATGQAKSGETIPSPVHPATRSSAVEELLRADPSAAEPVSESSPPANEVVPSTTTSQTSESQENTPHPLPSRQEDRPGPSPSKHHIDRWIIIR